MAVAAAVKPLIPDMFAGSAVEANIWAKTLAEIAWADTAIKKMVAERYTTDAPTAQTFIEFLHEKGLTQMADGFDDEENLPIYRVAKLAEFIPRVSLFLQYYWALAGNDHMHEQALDTTVEAFVAALEAGKLTPDEPAAQPEASDPAHDPDYYRDHYGKAEQQGYVGTLPLEAGANVHAEPRVVIFHEGAIFYTPPGSLQEIPLKITVKEGVTQEMIDQALAGFAYLLTKPGINIVKAPAKYNEHDQRPPHERQQQQRQGNPPPPPQHQGNRNAPATPPANTTPRPPTRPGGTPPPPPQQQGSTAPRLTDKQMARMKEEAIHRQMEPDAAVPLDSQTTYTLWETYDNVIKANKKWVEYGWQLATIYGIKRVKKHKNGKDMNALEFIIPEGGKWIKFFEQWDNWDHVTADKEWQCVFLDVDYRGDLFKDLVAANDGETIYFPSPLFIAVTQKDGKYNFKKLFNAPKTWRKSYPYYDPADLA